MSTQTVRVPVLYAHGITTGAGLDEGVTVMERSDEALWLKFDDDERVWPLGWAAYLSGKFVAFADDVLESAPWVRV